MDMRARRSHAFDAPRRLISGWKIHEVQQQQFALELAIHLQQDFQGQQRLQSAERTRHRAQHAGLGAMPTTPSAWHPAISSAGTRAQGRFVDLKLPFVLVHAGKNSRLLCEYGGIVDQVLGPKIVAAINDNVIGANQFKRVPALSRRRAFLPARKD